MFQARNTLKVDSQKKSLFCKGCLILSFSPKITKTPESDATRNDEILAFRDPRSNLLFSLGPGLRDRHFLTLKFSNV